MTGTPVPYPPSMGSPDPSDHRLSCARKGAYWLSCTCGNAEQVALARNDTKIDSTPDKPLPTLLDHREALRGHLATFWALCATDSQFENEVRRMVDEIQPHRLTGSTKRPRKDNKDGWL